MRWLLGALPLLSSCMTVDALLPFFSPIHCTQVSSATCDPDDRGWDPDNDPDWDAICTPCDDPYDWSTAHPWRAKTLDGDLEEIRGIEEGFVSRVPFALGSGEKLDAYFLASHGEVPELAHTTIVYSHGRYAGIEHYMPRVRILHELGYNVFIWDFRGYGKSEPEQAPTMPEFMADARRAFDHAGSIAPDPNRMIAYGMSLGGLAAGEMGATRAPCAQVYEAAVTSITGKIETNLALSMPGSFVTSGVMETHRKLKDTKVPALVLHGSLDNRALLDDAAWFFEQLPEDLPRQMVVIKGAGHGLGGIGGVPEDGVSAYRDDLFSFLDARAPDCLSP